VQSILYGKPINQANNQPTNQPSNQNQKNHFSLAKRFQGFHYKKDVYHCLFGYDCPAVGWAVQETCYPPVQGQALSLQPYIQTQYVPPNIVLTYNAAS